MVDASAGKMIDVPLSMKSFCLQLFLMKKD